MTVSVLFVLDDFENFELCRMSLSLGWGDVFIMVRWSVLLFFIVAITNYYKLSGFNHTTQIYYLQFCRSEVWRESHWDKISHLGYISFRKFLGILCPCLFQSLAAIYQYSPLASGPFLEQQTVTLSDTSISHPATIVTSRLWRQSSKSSPLLRTLMIRLGSPR